MNCMSYAYCCRRSYIICQFDESDDSPESSYNPLNVLRTPSFSVPCRSQSGNGVKGFISSFERLRIKVFGPADYCCLIAAIPLRSNGFFNCSLLINGSVYISKAPLKNVSDFNGERSLID